MYNIVIRGVNEDSSYIDVVIKASSIEEARTELIECMGMSAHTRQELAQELEAIGFIVCPSIEGPELLPIIAIPINLDLNNESAF